MQFTNLYEIPTSRDMISAFGGYNHNLRISDSEFYDMQNMTSEYYPVMSPRGRRGVYSAQGTGNFNGVIAKDSLCYVRGTKFYVNDYEVTGLALTDTPKQLISMGAYVIIMPDKKWVNTTDTSEYGSIDAEWGAPIDTTVKYEMCDSTGVTYTGRTARNTAPDPTQYQLWVDTSVTPHVLKQYTTEDSTWTPIPTTYVKISATGIASAFKQYDGVTINGIDESIAQLQDLNGKTSVLYAVSPEGTEAINQYIVVVGILDEDKSQEISAEGELSVGRYMPETDFIIESGNRLWGCRYGLNANEEVVNEIYASKLGDFTNWNCFMGISSDSYVASCGTDGAFTGAITHLGYPVFFKENCLHKVYGSFPSNFQIQQTACRGVMKGAGKSLAIVNERLYYKSRNGVCAYDGSLPVEISDAFAGIHYTGTDETDTDFLRNGATAAGHDNKYYISMRSEEDGKWCFFVYDTEIGMWHKEDNLRVDDMVSCRGDIYAIEHGEGRIVCLLGSGTKEPQKTKWSIETGMLGLGMPDHKYISRLTVRMSLEIGARVRFAVQYDGRGEWKHLATMVGSNTRSFTVTLKPQRCDHFRIRVEGEGEAKIYSVSKTIEQGSEY